MFGNAGRGRGRAGRAARLVGKDVAPVKIQPLRDLQPRWAEHVRAGTDEQTIRAFGIYRAWG